jgi:hypothetical protein
MSVEQIRLYTAKRKIHDSLSHNEHRTHLTHPKSLLVDLPQMLRQTPSQTPTNSRISIKSHMRTEAWDKKRT